MIKGQCLCGNVRVEIRGPVSPANACHCTACRRVSGHFEASLDVARDQVQVTGQEHVTWYASSAKVRRGFCGTCGANMFWDPIHHNWTAVALGCLEAPTGITLAKHIFVGEKGDYYEIADGLPQEVAPPK